MQPQTTQARIQRLLRKRRRQAEKLGAAAEDQLERNFVRKFGRLYSVRRFVIGWVLLCVALIGCVIVQTRALGRYYQTMQPVAGGIYREGVIGTYTNANPLYVAGQVNDSVSKLLFASLFKYDKDNRLVGDLAERYDIDAAGMTYTVTLKPDLTWHDGRALTAADVVFTYRTIQNPDAQSPLNVSWQNVVVSAKDDRTVVFKLSNPLSSFPHSLTTGIVPEHSFEGANIANYRSLPFNTVRPVGSGPFQFKTIEVKGNSPSTRQEEIELVPFKDYYAGAPAINSFIIHTYPNEEQMVRDFRDKSLNGMVGLGDVPSSLADDSNVQTTIMPLTAANMVFFKTSGGVLADKAVRQALVGGADVNALTQDLQKPILPIRSPFLPGTAGYDPNAKQTYIGPDAANALLDQAGWVRQPNKNNLRAKNGQVLTFKMYAQDSEEYSKITDGLKRQWQALGVDVQVYLPSEADLRYTVTNHAYDALLYGISLGADPDGFVYWHSSQADVRSPSRLNLSEYVSPVADASLEDGRTRQDPTLRAIKYGPFLKAWLQDAPALGLYQPRFLYITRGNIHGLTDRTITADSDRFNNVNQWMVRQAPKSASAGQ